MIKTNIKSTNISLTPAISDYVERKISMLEKFFDENDEVLAAVEVGKTTEHHKTGDIFRAEIKIDYRGETYYAASETPDLYASIDEVKDQIAYSLSSKKKKSITLLKRGGAKIKNLLKNHLWPRRKSS